MCLILGAAAGGLGWICGQQDTTLTMALGSGAGVVFAVHAFMVVTR